MTTLCKIFLFNGLRVQQGEREITRFQTQKTGSLLAFLAYYANRSHPREMLIDMLWPDADINAGRHSLSMALSSLRHQLEPPGVAAGTVIQASRFVVQINAEAITTDVAEFEATLRAAAKARSQTEQTQWLEQAVFCYSGELLRGYYEDWMLTEQRRLADRLFEAAQTLAERWQASSDAIRAIDVMRRVVAADPTREEAHLSLMRLYDADGQSATALRQYADLERMLDQQMGETPSSVARQLAAHISRNAVPPAAPSSVAPSPAANAYAFSPASGSPIAPARNPPPTGTVTFLFTDIEGSTAQWEAAGNSFRVVLDAHHALLRREFAQHQGWEVQEAGDGFIVAFTAAADALHCAIACQNALAAQVLSDSREGLRVRMALHAGDVTWQEENYQGLTLHRASRLLTAAHGGQILASEAVTTLLRRDLPPDVHLRDLGRYRLRDIPTPERLFQVDYLNAARSDFPTPRAEAGLTGNLPLTLTHFWGREKELGLLTAMLSPKEGEKREQGTGNREQNKTESEKGRKGEGVISRNPNDPTPNTVRLLTLTGPGGTGKTRLALEVGQKLMSPYAGAVWLAPLADLSDSDLIPDAILDALRIARARSVEPITQIVSALKIQPSLLILDNYEQLVEPGRNVVQSLLQQVPGLTILVTSRQLLELSGEREFVVLPLPTPQGARSLEQARLYESVQLFVDRAQAVRPDFQLTTSNAAAISELCDRLEGHPLALELAASRAQALSPAQMLAQLANRFSFLVTRKKDIATRHRTMRAAIDWSYDLLSPELRQIFAQLAVFRGGFTLEAVESVCDEPLALDYLAQLRECSLIVTREEGEETRFGMLETLREYAGERLTGDERTELSRRHALYFLEMAEQAGPQLTSGEQGTWLECLTREHENLRVALQSTLDAEDGAALENALRAASALERFFLVKNHLREGREWLHKLLNHPQTATSGEARAKALTTAAALAYFQSDLAATEQLASESLEVSRAFGYVKSHATALNLIGIAAMDRGDYQRARSLLEECEPMLRALNNSSSLGALLNNLGNVLWELENLGVARAAHEEALSIRRMAGDEYGIASSLSNLGNLAVDQNDAPAARAYLHEALQRLYVLANKRLGAICLEGLAALVATEKQFERAVQLHGAAKALREANGVPNPVEERQKHEHELAEIRKTLGAKSFAAVWEAGQAMTWEQALDYALASSVPPS